jgi:hypothetical protein
MIRNGGSQTVTHNEGWFETTVIVCFYRHPSLPEETTPFVGVDLIGSGSGNPDLIAGRCEGPAESYRLGEALRQPQPHSDLKFQSFSAASHSLVFPR